MRNGIPNLGALQAFEATARLGTFSRAAEELSLTHSAVHRQVAGLEARLGVSLFTRVRRRVALTDAGAEYAARVRHHLEQIEEDTFGLISRAGLGRSVHVAVLPTVATTWLLPRLPQFRRRHGDISVNLSVRTLPFQFRDHPFDAAVYHAVQAWPHTRSIRLFEERALLPVCTPQAWASIGGRPENLPALTHLHIMSRPDAWRLWYRGQGMEYAASIGAGPRYELFTMIQAAVHAGLGIALMPLFLAEEGLKSGRLVAPFKDGLMVQESYFFGYPATGECSGAVLAFESWLRDLTAAEAKGCA